VAVFAATAQIDAAGETKAATLEEYAAKRARVNESNLNRALKNLNFDAPDAAGSGSSSA